MRNLLSSTFVALALIVASPGVRAQDASKTATYGEIVLKAGFNPDPYQVSVTAGAPSTPMRTRPCRPPVSAMSPMRRISK